MITVIPEQNLPNAARKSFGVTMETVSLIAQPGAVQCKLHAPLWPIYLSTEAALQSRHRFDNIRELFAKAAGARTSDDALREFYYATRC